jgi:RNA polymerase sigma-32 factor
MGNMAIAPALDMSSLALFRREIRRFPRLSREEEYRLAKRWRENRDREAARALVCANLYSVVAIAREYRHFGLPEMDLVQEGTIGLMHAVKRFDPDRGFRLITYASWWIRAAIHDFILRSWSIVRVGTTKLQRKIFAGLKRAKEAIAAMEGKGRGEVAERYGISEHAYQEAVNAYLQRDISIDADEEGRALVEALPSPEPDPEQKVLTEDWRNYQNRSLMAALSTLPARDQLIVRRRHLSETPASLKELAAELGISIERVRQLEARALQKIKARLA